MKAFINHHLFTQTSLDSGSLTMLGSVIHTLPKPGEYEGRVILGTQTTATFRLSIGTDFRATQVNIDLAALSASRSEDHENESSCLANHRFAIQPNGHAVFFVSHGQGGYAVVVGKVGEKAPVFESTDLKEGDLFAATLIRPGTYSVVNLNTQARGEAVVEYPNLGKEPYHPPPPLMIECTKDALKPSRIRLKPAQGHVYSFKTRSRIKIELSRADDGYENEHRPGLSEDVSH